MYTNPRRVHRIVARSEAVQRHGRRKFATTSIRALAKALDIEPLTMYRMLRGETQPSPPMIALLVITFEAPFEELFAIENPTAPQAAAA